MEAAGEGHAAVAEGGGTVPSSSNQVWTGLDCSRLAGLTLRVSQHIEAVAPSCSRMKEKPCLFHALQDVSTLLDAAVPWGSCAASVLKHVLLLRMLERTPTAGWLQLVSQFVILLVS